MGKVCKLGRRIVWTFGRCGFQKAQRQSDGSQASLETDIRITYGWNVGSAVLWHGGKHFVFTCRKENSVLVAKVDMSERIISIVYCDVLKGCLYKLLSFVWTIRFKIERYFIGKIPDVLQISRNFLRNERDLGGVRAFPITLTVKP